jgi:cytochrome c oxidase assembly factor CtaG
VSTDLTSSRAQARAEVSPWRWTAAAAALVVLAAHVPVTSEHLSAAPYIGWLFIALEVATAVLAAFLVLDDRAVVWTAAAVVPTLAIVAYVLSRSLSLPQIADDVGNWTEPLGVVAISAELVLLVVVLVRRAGPAREAVRRIGPVALGATVLLLGLVATAYATQRGGDGMAMGHTAHGSGEASTLPRLRWASLMHHWHLDPSWLVFCLVALTGYVAAYVIARRHQVPTVHPARVGAFVVGIALLLFTVSSAVDSYAMVLFWDHMIEHLLLITAVPALLVLGHPITAVRAAASTRGKEGSVDAFALSWPVSVLTHPLVGFVLYAAVIIVTHLTGFMDTMTATTWLMGAEKWLYLATGYVYLLPLLGAEPIRWRLPYLGRLLLILLGMSIDAIIGIVLLQTDYNMFPTMLAGEPSWAPSPLSDIQLGGSWMWLGGDGLMMLMGLGVSIAMLSHQGSKDIVGPRLESVRRRTLAEHLARGGDDRDVAEDVDVDSDESVLAAYNRMLARMNDSHQSSGTTPPG